MHALETMMNAVEAPGLKGADCYVCPESRHWPVWDKDAEEWFDANNYTDRDAPEDAKRPRTQTDIPVKAREPMHKLDRASLLARPHSHFHGSEAGAR